MAARSFNARNGLSVGTTPTEVVDASGNITTGQIDATTGNITTLNVSGDLTVSGTTTYINTTNLNVGDNIITLNADVTSGTPTENAGIEVRRGASANTALRWNESSDIWEITQDGTNYGRIHSKLTDIVLGTDTSGNYVSSVTSGTTAITITGTASEGWAPTVSIRSATTSVDGIVQLIDSVSSTSTSTAATPNSVKTAYDVAFGRLSAVDLSTTANTVANRGILSITPSNGSGALTRDDVFFVGTGTTTVSSNSTQITINSADQFTGTVTSVATGNGIFGGTITTSGTLYAIGANGISVTASGINVLAGSTLVSNSTGVHMPNVATAGSSTGGISAITVDAQGRVTSITGSAGYSTTVGTVTSVASGNGLTGGPITSSGTLSVVAGTGVVSNATGVHIGQPVATTSGVTFANVTIQNNATFGVLSQVATGNSTVAVGNVAFTANGTANFNIRTVAQSAGGSSPSLYVSTGNVTGTGSSGGIFIEPGSKQTGTSAALTLSGGQQTNTTSSSSGWVYIYGGDHAGGNGGGAGTVTGGNIVIRAGNITNSSANVATKTPGSVTIDGGFSANTTGLNAPYIRIGTNFVHSEIKIGSTTSGNTIIYANGSIGSAGQTLHTNGTSVYWAADDQGVTSVATGNGLTGGTITATGTVSVLANNGIVANSTGIFVNAGTGLVSNSTGVHMASVATAGSSTGGISAITIDAQGRVTSVTGSAGYTTTSGTVTSVTGGSGLTGSVSTSGSLAVGAGSGITVNADDVAVNAQSGLLANSSGLYVNASSIALGTVPAARLPAASTTAAGVVQLSDSTSTTSSILAATPTAVKSAYDLAASKGTGTVTSVGAGNGLTGTAITTSGTLAVGQGNGITVGASLVHVNAQTGLTANSSGLYVRLTDSVSSTSTTTAATPASVKSAYDLANSKAATNQTMFVGTTSLAINRTSASQTLTGVSIDGNAATASSVAWTNVSGRPTTVSSFTNDSGYITSSSQSVTKYAALRYDYDYDYGTRYSAGTGFNYNTYGAKNVSSLTWNSAGDITINFTTAFSNANYKSFLQAPGGTSSFARLVYTGIETQTTTTCRVLTKYTSNSSGGQFMTNPGGIHNFMAVEFA
jgi:hypothetical protein